MHLADDWSDAILTEGCERLSYAKNLKTLTYKKLQQDFQRNLGDADGCAYWDFATPWARGVMGCLETYRLIPIDMESGELGDEIEYTFGIAIQGCSFRNAVLDEGAREIILQNGGKGV